MATPDPAAMSAPRVCFSRAETTAFLAIVDEMRIGELLDSRRQRNQVHFVRIQEEMSCLGYTWIWQQLRTHWKSLKGKYNKERELQKLSGAAPSKWRWYHEMSAILAHRPTVEAQDYGIDSGVVGDAAISPTQETSDAEDWSLETELTAESTNTNWSSGPGSAHSSQGSATSSNDRTGGEPPTKRPRCAKYREMAELMQEQHERNAQMLKDHSQVMFEQQKELMKASDDSFKETMTQITATFLQGTQSILSQLITGLPQTFVQPSSPFRGPQMHEAPTWSFGQPPQPYNHYVQRSNATASPLHRATPQVDVRLDAIHQDSVHTFSPLRHPEVGTDVQGTSDANTGQD